MNTLKSIAFCSLLLAGIGLVCNVHCEEVITGEGGLPLSADATETEYLLSGQGRIDSLSLTEKEVVVSDTYLKLADSVKFVDADGTMISPDRFVEGVMVAWETESGRVVVLSYLAEAVVDAPGPEAQIDKEASGSYNIRLEGGVYRN